MDYILRQPLTSADIDFLNETTMHFDIINTHGFKPETTIGDSGWRDVPTDARIIVPNDRAIFRNISEEELTYLTLRFHDRIILLTSGLEKIYNTERH